MRKGPVFFILLAPLLMTVLTACPGNNPKKSNTPPAAGVRMVKGDPYVFIKDTANNGGRPLPEDLIPPNSVWIASTTGYEEQNAITNTRKHIDEKETPGQIEEDSGGEVFEVTQAHGGLIMLGDRSRYVFRQHENGLVLVEASIKSRPREPVGGAMEVVHTSYLEDLSAFSILVFSKTPGRRKVVAVYFQRGDRDSRVRKTKAPYEYLFGRGVKIGWARSKPVEVKVCGRPPSPLTDHVLRAVDKWQQALGDRLEIRAVPTPRCPPFSDLHSQTFTYVNDWIEIAGTDGMAGQTSGVAHKSQGVLLDADVFILLTEYQEKLDKQRGGNIGDPRVLNSPKLVSDMLSTAIHELGHLLGLHHMFQEGVKSVMSYEDDPVDLQDYDIKAIRSLYDDKAP